MAKRIKLSEESKKDEPSDDDKDESGILSNLTNPTDLSSSTVLSSSNLLNSTMTSYVSNSPQTRSKLSSSLKENDSKDDSKESNAQETSTNEIKKNFEQLIKSSCKKRPLESTFSSTSASSRTTSDRTNDSQLTSLDPDLTFDEFEAVERLNKAQTESTDESKCSEDAARNVEKSKCIVKEAVKNVDESEESTEDDTRSINESNFIQQNPRNINESFTVNQIINRPNNQPQLFDQESKVQTFVLKHPKLEYPKAYHHLVWVKRTFANHLRKYGELKRSHFYKHYKKSKSNRNLLRKSLIRNAKSFLRLRNAKRIIDNYRDKLNRETEVHEQRRRLMEKFTSDKDRALIIKLPSEFIKRLASRYLYDFY